MALDLEHCAEILQAPDLVPGGRVTRVSGDTVEAILPHARTGAVYRIRNDQRDDLLAEVIGFKDHSTILAPFGTPRGIGPGQSVVPEGGTDEQKVGDEWLGRVVDALGRPLDGGPPLRGSTIIPIYAPAPNPMERHPITRPLETGVAVIDAMMTSGEGQRLGVFAGAGAGKSTLLAMLARNSDADVTVLCLVGERGREVRSFIEHTLGKEGMENTVVLVATGDNAAILRMRVAFLATSLAEYFRDQGRKVLLVMDSLTRLAHAGRELGLAAGEPPATRGYPPYVFAMLPKLVERAGNHLGSGSITAFYSVLVEGDDMTEPVADSVRALLDGHIILSRRQAEAGRFPAIDVLASLSRMAEELISPEHLQLTRRVREIFSIHAEYQDLIQVGAYRPGTNRIVDRAITLTPKLTDYFLQGRTDSRSLATTIQGLEELLVNE